MICRSCGREERASEGYPCKDCGTFICIMCVFKGVVRCERCAVAEASAQGQVLPQGAGNASAATTGARPTPGTRAATDLDWPEH
jgi:hypothetical protein